MPIDICPQAVASLTQSLRCRLPAVADRVYAVVGEHAEAMSLLRGRSDKRNLVLFLGSSIGNFDPPATAKLLRDLHQSLNDGDYLLIGFDRKKDVSVVWSAYNDAQGVTREFNFNLLDRINRELGGEFRRQRFLHYAPYNARRGCMESWLISREDQRVRIAALDREFFFERGRESASNVPTSTAWRTWTLGRPKGVSPCGVTSSTGGATFSIPCGKCPAAEREKGDRHRRRRPFCYATRY